MTTSTESRTAAYESSRWTQLNRSWAGRSLIWTATFSVLALGAWSCNSGGRDGDSNIPGLVSSAAPLPEDNRVYRGPRLTTSRYGHTATALSNGTVLVAGGSDERHFNSIDTAEIFDQTARTSPVPESISGRIFDTNFTGDPMVMNFGGRVFHTATLLPDGNVLICGGSFDILVGDAIARAEIFDRQTRQFAPSNLEIQNDMIYPRFRHTATPIPNGKVLIAGGQLSVDQTIIDPNWPPGHPLFMVDIKTFPSTNRLEYFNRAALSFEPVVDLAGDEVTMGGRGRSEHATAVIAGQDQVLGTSDDLVVFTGGYRTLSPLFAPQVKIVQAASGLDTNTSIEYLEVSASLTMREDGNVITLTRSEEPQAINLGKFKRLTPPHSEGSPEAQEDGVDGMANVLAILGGSTPGYPTTSRHQTELLAATFTGLGPAGGLQLQYNAVAQGLFGIENLVLTQFMCGGPAGRTTAEAVLVPYERLINGEPFRGAWIIIGGGAHLFIVNGVQAQNLSTACIANDVRGFEYFDPFYDVALDPPTQLAQDGSLGGITPTGVVGTWMQADGLVPEDGLDGFADGATPLPSHLLSSGVAFHTLTVIPGEDGISDTKDDRVVVLGGGSDWELIGGDAVSTSCHIFLPEGANNP